MTLPISKDLHFEILSQENKSEIVALRQKEYSIDYGSLVDLSRLEWNDKDENSIHLGLRWKNELASCLRLTFIQSQQAFQSVMAAPLQIETGIKYAVLARAATRTDMRQSHCHSFLRYQSLQICADNQVNAIWGSAERSSTRLAQLIELGYSVQDYDKKEGSFLKNASQSVALQLCGTKSIRMAISKLEEKLTYHFNAQHLKAHHSFLNSRKIIWL